MRIHGTFFRTILIFFGTVYLVGPPGRKCSAPRTTHVGFNVTS